MSRTPAFARAELEGASSVLHEQARHVRFQDVDAAGTAFFPRVVEYFADVYLGLLEARGVDLPSHLRAPAWVAPLVHAEADFLGPMRFGDRFVAQVVAARVGATSFSVGYRLRAEATGKVLAVGHTVHVIVDGATFQPAPVPEVIRRALGADTSASGSADRSGIQGA